MNLDRDKDFFAQDELSDITSAHQVLHPRSARGEFQTLEKRLQGAFFQ